MKFRKILAGVLAVLFLLPLAAGCRRESDGEQEETSEKAEAQPLNDWVIVFPNNEKNVKSLAQTLRDKISSASGVTLTVKSDYEADSGAKEILLGKTSRELSTTLYSELGDTEYRIRRSGNKIAIAAVFDSVLEDAAGEFVKSYISAASLVMAPNASFTSDAYDFLKLAENKKGIYKIVYPKSAGTALRALVNDLNSYIAGLTYAYVSTVEDSDSLPQEQEILVGYGNRPESAAVYADLPYNSYTVRRAGQKIVIAGWSQKGLEQALNRFKSALKLGQEKAMYYVNNEEENTNSVLSGVGDVDVPAYTGGKVSNLFDCNDGVTQLYVTETDRAAYRSYLGTLEAAGYALYQEVEYPNVLYATYNNAAKGQSLFLQFCESESMAKIMISPLATMLPLAPENPGVKLKDSTFAMLAIGDNGDGTNNAEVAFGASFVIQLEDGRFVIIDGGTNQSSEVNRIYNYLMANKPASHAKPVIAAWILTHPDGDHWGAMYGFSQRHGGDVVLEKFIYNIYDSSVIYGMKEAAVKANVNVHDTIVPQAMANFGCTTVIKLHSGQKFYLGNALFETLVTHEDLYPGTIDHTNDSSIVLRLTLGGKTFLLTADIEGAAAKRLVSLYGTALKSDYIQIMHHGWPGNSSAEILFNSEPYTKVYEMADATYALWSAQLDDYHYNMVLKGRQMKLVYSLFAVDKILSTTSGNIIISCA